MVSDGPVNTVREGHQLLREGQCISNRSTAGFSWRHPHTHTGAGKRLLLAVCTGTGESTLSAEGQRGPQGHATAGRDSKAGRGLPGAEEIVCVRTSFPSSFCFSQERTESTVTLPTTVIINFA